MDGIGWRGEESPGHSLQQGAVANSGEGRSWQRGQLTPPTSFGGLLPASDHTCCDICLIDPEQCLIDPEHISAKNSDFTEIQRFCVTVDGMSDAAKSFGLFPKHIGAHERTGHLPGKHACPSELAHQDRELKAAALQILVAMHRQGTEKPSDRIRPEHAKVLPEILNRR